MSSYIPQDENKIFICGIKPSTTVHALPLCPASLGTTVFFNIYTTISEKMTSQNKLG
jgi:hypothetical protein